MLLLNEQEMRAAVTCEDIMEAVEKAFLLFEKGDCKMADRYTASDKGNTMLYMPCFVDGVIGTKMLAEFPGNPVKGYPYLSGLMVLNNAGSNYERKCHYGTAYRSSWRCGNETFF